MMPQFLHYTYTPFKMQSGPLDLTSLYAQTEHSIQQKTVTDVRCFAAGKSQASIIGGLVCA